MIGYHYTSKRNWRSISKDGIKPYEIYKPELEQWFDFMPVGVWIWEQPLSPESELGSIIYQLANRGQTQIVKLEVEYNYEDLLFYEGNGFKQKIHLLHSGVMENWSYHKDKPEAVIVLKTIQPDKIKLIKTFDLMDVVDGKKQTT